MPHATCLSATRRSSLLALALWMMPLPVTRAQEPIAIVVQPGNPLTDISLDAVRRLYLGRRTTFPNGELVVLVETASLRDRFYSKVLGMNADRFKRHWIGMVFSGETASPPKDGGDPEDVERFVASHPGAIAFVALNSVKGSVKILAVDGVRPGSSSYPLR